MAVRARLAPREAVAARPLRAVGVRVATARSVPLARPVRLNGKTRVRLNRLEHDILRLVPQLQRVFHGDVSVTVAPPVARRAVPALGALARPVVLTRPVVRVALLALHRALPAGVPIPGGDAVDELLHDPDHVVVGVSNRLERARRGVEPAARHRVYQTLSLVDVVREPHVLSLGGLHRFHRHHLNLTELEVAFADKVRLDDVVAVPRANRVPLRAAAPRRPAEQLTAHLLQALALFDDVGHVGVLADFVVFHGPRNALHVRDEGVSIRLELLELVVNLENLDDVGGGVPEVRLVGSRRQVRVRRAVAALGAVRTLVLQLPDVILQVVRVHVNRVHVTRPFLALNLVHVLAAFDVKRVAGQAQGVSALLKPPRAVAQAGSVVLARAVVARLARREAPETRPTLEAIALASLRVAQAVLAAGGARNLAPIPRPSLEVVVVSLALETLGARVFESAVAYGIANAVPPVERLALDEVDVVDVAVPPLHLSPLVEEPLRLVRANKVTHERVPHRVRHREQVGRGRPGVFVHALRSVDDDAGASVPAVPSVAVQNRPGRQVIDETVPVRAARRVERLAVHVARMPRRARVVPLLVERSV
mmetsp:Transcript_9746/g.39913  ORF Transcript_9746/g.39913 Transcript_9746/m.39913 type:complete len:594 (-) Transcript_9746:3239-5020(-)